MSTEERRELILDHRQEIEPPLFLGREKNHQPKCPLVALLTVCLRNSSEKNTAFIKLICLLP